MYAVIDGKKIEFSKTDTILSVANNNGIEIPTLCNDKRFPHYTSCFICIVQDLKTGKLIPSCSASIYDKMEISTNNEEVRKYRKLALELLLSEHDADCFSPCKTSCPAGIDARDYILFAKDKKDLSGFLKVREKNPLVSIVGRVCPAFCQKDCSRNEIDETLSIRLIKKTLGDTVYQQHRMELFDIEKTLIKKLVTPKKVAIIGGGPCGLSCAYYLRMNGHYPTIYDENPALGGMLRYSIPEYRLPREILDKEIDSILQLGIEVKVSTKVDGTKLSELKKEHDAVVVCIGTWKESGLGLGEDKFSNVYSALSFLKIVSENKKTVSGKKAIVIGGGNSAVDSARTLLRLGFSDVSLSYRRTKEQMPASPEEVQDALKEGVKLYELVAPTELQNKKISFSVMELSCELDSSGRKKVCETGKKIEKEFDVLVYAVGQKAETELLSTQGVLICGDAKNGASTVIEAVADGRKAAFSLETCFIDELSFYSQRQSKTLPKELLSYAKLDQVHSIHRDPLERIKDFKEAELGFTPALCSNEAERCLNCGCGAIEDCTLRDLSIEYNAEALKYKDQRGTGGNTTFVDETTKYIIHEQSKCIKCGTCVRVCKNVAGVSAVSFIGRGFNSKIAAGPTESLIDSSCILCGMCIDSCPTGALLENTDHVVRSKITQELRECDLCELRCKLNYGISNGEVFRARSYDTPICFAGRWGWKFKPCELVDLKGLKIAKASELGVAKLIICLVKDQRTDNPRMKYELDKALERGAKVIFRTSLDMSDPEIEQDALVVIDYLETLKHYDLKGFRVLPVYWTKPTINANSTGFADSNNINN